jgi:hypothetical protein
MLDRNMQFVYQFGELATDDSTTHSWVAGAPVGLNSAGEVSANFNTTGKIAFLGVAKNTQANDLEKTGYSAYIKGPCIVTISKGDDDDYSPWDEGVSDWAVGQLLRPILKNTSGSLYSSVWSNASLTDLGGRFAMIIAMTGTASAPTSLTIELGNFPVVID